jgi:molecular chaperone GrpE
MSKHHKQELPPPADEEPKQTPEGAAQGDAGEADEATSGDLEEARRECMELMDRLQRTAADYQNFQKRVARRMDEAVESAVRDVAIDLLPIIDNFDRALEAARAEPDVEAIRRGVELVREQLRAALAKHGVEPIEADGKPFDPEHHEAVERVPSDEVPKNHVAEVLQTGYRLGDRTIRPSKVIVSSGPGGEA